MKQAGNPHQRSPRPWPDALLILILALLPCLFFWRLLSPNPVDRMQLASGDFTDQYFPLRAFTAQQWVRGQIPLWNPYLYGGQPALADIQSGALYPPHLIEALILGWGGPLFGRELGFPVAALEWQVIAHFSLAAIGTYLFARRHFLGRFASTRRQPCLRRARFGGLIASLVFTYGGYLTGFPVQQLTILAVSAWLPWILWGLSAAGWQRGQWRRAIRPIAWGGLALAMAILAGHPQTVLYIVYLTLAYALFQGLTAGWNEAQKLPPSAPHTFPLPGRLAASLIPWLAMVLLGNLIAAAQLLPTLEFIRRSLRANLSYQAVSAGLPLNEFISILYPGFWGGSPEYVGIVALVLIGLALVLAQPRAEVFFWAGAGLAGFLLAFGGNTFLYPIFYLLAPGFEAVRQQERAFLVYSFSAAILAGYGAVVLAGPLSKLSRLSYILFERRLRLVTAVAVGLTGFFIYGSAAATARGDQVNLFFGVLRHHLFGLLMLGGMVALLALRPRRWLRRTWGMSLIAVWLAFNLFTVNWRFNLEKPAASGRFTPTGLVQFLQSAVGVKGQTRPLPGRIASGGLLPGGNSAASVYNLQDLTGNTPLQLATVAAFFQQMPAWRLWQLMNVRYIVADRDLSGNGLALVFEEAGLKVFEMGDPFPRAWFVFDTETIPDDAQAIARLASDDFDLRRAAILPAALNVSLAVPVDSSVDIITFSPTRLTATVRASGNQLLVLSQIYDPGWQVAIDGQSADLWRVNVIQQGVVVPGGEHLVELTYWPASFRLGGILSILGGIIWLVMVTKRYPGQ